MTIILFILNLIIVFDIVYYFQFNPFKISLKKGNEHGTNFNIPFVNCWMTKFLSWNVMLTSILLHLNDMSELSLKSNLKVHLTYKRLKTHDCFSSYTQFWCSVDENTRLLKLFVIIDLIETFNRNQNSDWEHHSSNFKYIFKICFNLAKAYP